MKKRTLILIAVALVLIASAAMETISFLRQPSAPQFDGERAYQDVLAQTGFGPRVPDSQAHADTVAYIGDQLAKAGWTASIQTLEINGHKAQNIVGERGGQPPAILLGAHYDTRMLADNDPDPANQQKPVPGANDGASGVAVLLELARSLPQDSVPVRLVFFDIEDDGGIGDWDWILGSRAYANALTDQPKAVVVLDMIGDADLNIYYENNSDQELTHQIWDAAKRLGYDNAFVPHSKYSMEDDHTPFIEKGLRAVDIIDFDYPYWHTVQDTADKVSAKSLQIVGASLLEWIKTFPK